MGGRGEGRRGGRGRGREAWGGRGDCPPPRIFDKFTPMCVHTKNVLEKLKFLMTMLLGVISVPYPQVETFEVATKLSKRMG